MCTLECGGIKRGPIEKVDVFYPQMVHLFVLYFCLRSHDCLCMKMQCIKCMPLTCLCCFGNWTALKFWQNGAVCCDLCGNFLILIGRWCWCCKTVKGFLLPPSGQLVQSTAVKVDTDKQPRWLVIFAFLPSSSISSFLQFFSSNSHNSPMDITHSTPFNILLQNPKSNIIAML